MSGGGVSDVAQSCFSQQMLQGPIKRVWAEFGGVAVLKLFYEKILIKQEQVLEYLYLSIFFIVFYFD